MINIYALDYDNVLTIGNVLNTPWSKTKALYMEQNGNWFQFKDGGEDNELLRELVPVSPKIEFLLQLKANQIKRNCNWEEGLLKQAKLDKMKELE